MTKANPADFAHRTVRSGDIALHCATLGPPDGPLVVLLHGFPARWSTWRAPMRALAQAGFLAVAPDLRGYGESDKPAGVASYSVPRIVEDVAAIVGAFGRQRASVAGHDVGGGVAWATAMDRPDIVERVAILNSVHPVGFLRAMRKGSQLVKSWYVFVFQLPWLPERLLGRRDFRFLRRSLADDGLAPDVVSDLIEGVTPPGALHAAIDWYRASFRDGASGKIKPVKVSAPALVVWGDRERHLDPELATPPPEWVTDARVEHVPEGGHWVQHDAPERVSALLVKHFRGT
jgi:pimeloyl-ACP methyl ester carboxylesterase